MTTALIGDYPDDAALARVRTRVETPDARRTMRAAAPSRLLRVAMPVFAAAAVLTIGITVAVLRPWASDAPVELPVGSPSTDVGSPSESTVDIWVTPLREPYVLEDLYGPRWGRVHWGVDLVAAEGTPIYAVHDGVVELSYHEENGYGIHAQIDHGNGVMAWYGHMSEIYVATGQTVVAGQFIGRVGSTGRAAGPHLHLEIRVNGGYWDTVAFMRQHGVDLEAGAST